MSQNTTATNKPVQSITLPAIVETVWEVRTYDVWGNARDGYDVNDSFVIDREYKLRLRVKVYNSGTAGEFIAAYPTDRQIRKALGLTNVQLDLDGDDLNITVNRSRDGYPIGELICISHSSLSPISELILAPNV